MTASSDTTVAQAIVNALQRHGVEFIFGQSLPSAVMLAAEASGIRQVSYREENSGGAMADGFARLSGKVGVVAAQNGPAATLLVPPLSEAFKASVPIVALVQDVDRPTVDRNAFQDLDHFALFSACTKLVRRLPSADRVDDYVDMAFSVAASGRPGPVVLMLPADLLKDPAVPQPFPRTTRLGHWPLDRQRPGEAQIAAAARLIAEAKYPIVLAGGGAVSSRADAALARLQDEAHLPVFTTLMGKGAVDEHHPLSGGVIGPLTGKGSLGRRSRDMAQEADVVLLVGTRTNQNGTDSWRLFPPTAQLIHVDVDPVEIGRTYEAMRLTGDAAETISALATALSKLDVKSAKARRPAVEKRLADAWAAYAADQAPMVGSNGSPIRPERLMSVLQPHFDRDDVVVVADASFSSMWITGYLRSSKVGRRIVTPRGLAGLGWGLPMALGAKVARPDARVIAVVGDGGFAHCWAEMETAARSKLPVTIILLNNGILGFQKYGENRKFGAHTSAIYFTEVDHAAIARACGCEGVRITEASEFEPALTKAMASDKPTLLEIITDPEAKPPLSNFE
jgi:acetolactate synthase-1/2/3 large subunit